MKALIACEFSGTVRNAFLAAGFDAWSCDLLPSPERSNRHITGDVRDVLNDGWDLMMVAHPPCTRLCNSGVRWLKEPPSKITAEHYSAAEIADYKMMDREKRLAFMWQKLDEGAALFSDLWNAPIPYIAIENPVMHKHAKERIKGYEPFAQTVQPYEYGHKESKRTCLWLRGGLPVLKPTDMVGPPPQDPEERKAWFRVHNTPPGPERWKERSKFFNGIATAMATQWAALIAAGELKAKPEQGLLFAA